MAGESIQEEIDRVYLDDLFPWVSVAMFTAVFAAIDLIRRWMNTSPHAVIVSVLAVVMIGYSFFRLRRAASRLRQLRQGQAGERAVAETLDALRTSGSVVFHSIPGDGFNVDHVVISRRGIFVIETKIISKRPGARETHADGAALLDGQPMDRNPLAQARASARLDSDDVEDEYGHRVSCPRSRALSWLVVDPMKKTDGTDTCVLNRCG
jgi:hypothetical protein